ncbi:hypothetical protein [Variovorax sp. OV329]|uniref:hypothetical protein n=1 Tax=Variovorax sp. OV329 TaxID=1882825 RepID=UPI0008E9E18F|nr:hypothetical protein [Variovorax sp. OV329]SFM92072.1 hypothetical protein SAMN05444747_11137 [Variovorax sp. OV329]
MSATEIAILALMSVYALWRQSMQHAVSLGPARFKLALIYAGAGLVIGGYHLPPDRSSWLTLAGSLLASVGVGLLRGRYTRLWRDAQGQLWSQGTPLTITLFVLLVGGKFALGAWQYIHRQHPHGGFGEVLVMIALMLAMQSQIIWHRGRNDDLPVR